MRKIQLFLLITLCLAVAAGQPAYEKTNRDKRRAEILVISPPQKLSEESSETPKRDIKRELMDDEDEQENFEDNYDGKLQKRIGEKIIGSPKASRTLILTSVISVKVKEL